MTANARLANRDRSTAPLPALRLLVFLGFLTVSGIALWLVPPGGQRTPPSPTQLGSWLTDTQPHLVLIALLRFGALALTGYLFVCSLAALYNASRHTPATLPRWLAPAFLSMLLGRSMALGLAASTPLTAVVVTHQNAGSTALADDIVTPPTDSAGQHDTPPSIRRRPAITADDDVAAAEPTADGPSIRRRRPTATLEAGPIDAEPIETEPGEAEPAQSGAEHVNARDNDLESWLVGPGDHPWSIAEATMRTRLEREPTERETADYWLALLHQNRDQLIDPENPDLIIIGQALRLPT